MANLNFATLVIVAKRPKLGQGKQRLATTLGQQSAFEIAQQLFACTLEDGLSWPGPKVLAISDQADLSWAKDQVPNDWMVLHQTTGNLGERLNMLDTQLRANGHPHHIYIGTDCPLIHTAYLAEVSTHLQHNNFVIGDAEDGGVVVMANAKPWPDLASLAWSTSQLGSQLAGAVTQNNASLSTVPMLYDIDTQADLVKLSVDLAHDTRDSRIKLLQLLTQITHLT